MDSSTVIGSAADGGSKYSEFFFSVAHIMASGLKIAVRVVDLRVHLQRANDSA